MTRQGRWTLFGAFAAGSVASALAFATAGAWPVLPWSAIELAVLAWAFVHIERRSGDWERLTVDGDRVVVERSLRGVRTRHEFNRPWVQVELAEGGMLRDPRIALRCSGEVVPFGEALPAAERVAVARELGKRIGARTMPGPDRFEATRT